VEFNLFFAFSFFLLILFAAEASVQVTLFDQSKNTSQIVAIPFDKLKNFPLIEGFAANALLVEGQPSCCKHDREISPDLVDYETFDKVLYPLVNERLLPFVVDEDLISEDKELQRRAIANSATRAIVVIGWFNEQKIQTNLIQKVFVAADFLQMPSLFIIRRACVNYLYDQHCSHFFDTDTYRLISNSDRGGAVESSPQELKQYYNATLDFKKRDIRFCDLDHLVRYVRSQQTILPASQIHFDFSGNKIQEIDFERFAQFCQDCPELKLSVFDFRENPLSEETKEHIKTTGIKNTVGLNENKAVQTMKQDSSSLLSQKFFLGTVCRIYAFLLPFLWLLSFYCAFRLGRGFAAGAFISFLTTLPWLWFLSKRINAKGKAIVLQRKIEAVTGGSKELIRIGDLFFLY
jgi:hypothetical protein